MRVYWDIDYKDYLCSFELMVKSGEVYTTPSLMFDSQGYLADQKSRPRAIMKPTYGAYGMMQSVQ